MKKINLKPFLVILLVLYLIGSSRNGYKNNAADLNTITDGIEAGYTKAINAVDPDKKRVRKRKRQLRRKK